MLIDVILLPLLLKQAYSVPSDAVERCNVFSTGNSDRYEFVKISEVSTGQIVLQSTIRGGQSRGVFARSDKIKIERKWAGDVDYHSAIVVTCDKGNTIRI